MSASESLNGAQTSGAHQSYWIESTLPIEFNRLNESISTEVVIVGAGIAGLMTAYGLVKRGHKVVVVDDGFVGSGETGRTTAHLVTALDDRYYELQKVFGKDDAKLAAESHAEAISFYEQIINDEQIDCDFIRLDGYLFLHPTDDAANLEREFIAADESGCDVEPVSEMPGIQLKGTPAIKFKRQAQFHPMKFLRGLCDAIVNKGGQIYTCTHAKDISKTGITTDEDFTITAQHVVVATNSPVNNTFVIHTKMYSYRTYVIGARVKKGALPYALWWDTGDYSVSKQMPPYHYVRLQPLDDTYDVLISGGEDHAQGLIDEKDRSEEERYELLESWTRRMFPVVDVIDKWSGEVREPMDALAYIGHNPLDSKNIYIITGDSGNGMTHGAIAGMLIPDLIEGKENKWQKIYSPDRVKLSKSNVFIKEFIGGFFEYIKQKPKDADKVNISSMKPGDGTIIELDGKKYGAYRDEKDELHLVSAECTHLKCIVKWNGDEKSWDCPCHGSRFTHDGKVINGPANKNLDYHHEQNPVFFDQKTEQ